MTIIKTAIVIRLIEGRLMAGFVIFVVLINYSVFEFNELPRYSVVKVFCYFLLRSKSHFDNTKI
ncbi:hypothetical protein BGP_3096 [Beggiatoa sp. PS]|nr:hypothetical protein BGP_3096 [Beggiatoa sp. PS]